MIRLTHRQFERAVARAIEGLPPRFAALLDNVFVVVEEEPSAEDLESVEMSEDDEDELLGLYQGVPLDERGTDYSSLPDRVVLYRGPLQRLCESIPELESEICDTLVHELGHHFGLEDEEMPY
jgi:predicted Zn-dependent protease with MMP-like domain